MLLSKTSHNLREGSFEGSSVDRKWTVSSAAAICINIIAPGCSVHNGQCGHRRRNATPDNWAHNLGIHTQ